LGEKHRVDLVRDSAVAHLMLVKEQPKIVLVMSPDELSVFNFKISAGKVSCMPMTAATPGYPKTRAGPPPGYEVPQKPTKSNSQEHVPCRSPEHHKAQRGVNA
jgi:hypothetical protein